MAKIGFIGLGNMGLPMAQNLIKAGHQVEGLDVSAASLEKLKSAGGTVGRECEGACVACGRDRHHAAVRQGCARRLSRRRTAIVENAKARRAC